MTFPPIEPSRPQEILDGRQHRAALATERNVSTNGRWGVGAMIALCIAAQSYQLAFVWALVYFASWILEQLPGRYRLSSVIVLTIIVTALVAMTGWAVSL